MLGKREELQCDRPAGLVVAQHISFTPLGKVEIGQGESVQRSCHRS